MQLGANFVHPQAAEYFSFEVHTADYSAAIDPSTGFPLLQAGPTSLEGMMLRRFSSPPYVMTDLATGEVLMGGALQ